MILSQHISRNKKGHHLKLKHRIDLRESISILGAYHFRKL
jgi:hypothetical protein